MKPMNLSLFFCRLVHFFVIVSTAPFSLMESIAPHRSHMCSNSNAFLAWPVLKNHCVILRLLSYSFKQICSVYLAHNCEFLFIDLRVKTFRGKIRGTPEEVQLTNRYVGSVDNSLTILLHLKAFLPFADQLCFQKALLVYLDRPWTTLSCSDM